MDRAAISLALLFAGCHGTTRIAPPWSSAEVGVVGLAAASGEAQDSKVLVSRNDDPLEITVDDDRPLRLWAVAFSADRVDLDRCALRVEHDKTKEIPLSGSWLTQSFTPRGSPAQWESAQLSFGVSADCPPVDDTCAVGTVDSYSFGLANTGLYHAAPVSDDAVWLLGRGVDNVDDRTLVSLFDAAGRHDLPRSEGIQGVGRRLFIQDGKLYGATDIGYVFVRDLATGTSTSWRVDTYLNGLWRTPQGRLFAQVGRDPRFVEIGAHGSLTDLPTFPRKSRALAAPRDDFMVAGDGFGSILSFNGLIWSVDLAAPADSEFSSIASDGHLSILTTRYVDAYVSVSPGAWSRVRPPRVTFPASTALMSRGRAITVGSAGGIGLYIDGKFCTLPSRTSAPLWGVGVSPSGNVAWIAGEAGPSSDEPTLLRVSLPP
ncbi:MAG: hypothetical protein U1E65_07765 [Myxococcota bacterium]